MGGREFAALLDGATPDGGTLADVQALVRSATMAHPTFAEHGGPFVGSRGQVLCAGKPLATALPEGQRAALAALYCAQTTAWLVERLWQGVGKPRKLVLEGPLAHNTLYLAVLQALLPQARCLASHDAMEGTARGAWLLSRWGANASSALVPVQAATVEGLQAYHAAWLACLPI